MAERQRFQINTDPHVAEIGDDTEFQFKPEVFGDELIDTWAAMQAKLLEGSGEPPEDESFEDRKNRLKETQQRSSDAIRRFLSDLMLEESAARFADFKLPDRVLLELQRWALEVYGLRPTTPSSDSSQSSSTPTDSPASTTNSSPEASTS